MISIRIVSVLFMHLAMMSTAGGAIAQDSKEVHAASPEIKQETKSPGGGGVAAVGDAWLDKDGNLMLRMRRTSDGIPVHSLRKIAPGTKQFDDVLKHIGGLQPGETKLVPPWKETM